MGNGSTVKKDYRVEKGYICERDYDERNGQFWFFLEPLNSCDDEKFFYVKTMPDGQYEVTGEWYMFSHRAQLNEHLRELKEELAGKVIHYFFYDEKTGQVIRKET